MSEILSKKEQSMRDKGIGVCIACLGLIDRNAEDIAIDIMENAGISKKEFKTFENEFDTEDYIKIMENMGWVE